MYEYTDLTFQDESEASKPKTSPIVIGSMVNKPIKTYSATPRQHILTSGGGKTIQIISSQVGADIY